MLDASLSHPLAQRLLNILIIKDDDRVHLYFLIVFILYFYIISPAISNFAMDRMNKANCWLGKIVGLGTSNL